jgi:serine phosphatase RsbU (regulator of sigma subunit)/HAMP domain-containing protein
MMFKIKYKILSIFAIVSILILITYAPYVSFRLRELRINTIKKELQNQLQHIDFSINILFDEIEYDINEITLNSYVRSYDDEEFTSFLGADEKTFRYNIGKLEQKIIHIFHDHKNTHPYVNSVYMGRENGSFVRSHKRDRPTQYDPRERPWYRLGKDNPGNVMKTAPYRSLTSTDINIGFVKALKDQKDQVYGVVGFDITLEKLSRYLRKIEVEYEGSLLLLDNEGIILASQNESDLFQYAGDAFNIDFVRMYEKGRGVVAASYESEKYYIIFRESPTIGWKIAFVIPAEQIKKDIEAILFKIIVILAISLGLLSLFTVLGMEKHIIKHIRTLHKGTEIISRTGDLNHEIMIDTHDEIGGLAASFNQMTKDLIINIDKLTEETRVREKYESELNIAHDIQMSFLPQTFPPFPNRPEFDLYALIQPAREVGGDLYDFYLIDNNHLCFLIGDVSDKGVPAALFMARTKAVVKSVAGRIRSPREILTAVNNELSLNNEECMFVTLFLGILTIDSGHMVFANAGHNPPLYIASHQDAVFFKTKNSSALGLDADTDYSDHTIRLSENDTLFMYTDGVTEALNDRNQFFSDERLQKEVSIQKSRSIQDLASIVMDSVKTFSSGTAQSDDITILCLRYFHKSKEKEGGEPWN